MSIILYSFICSEHASVFLSIYRLTCPVSPPIFKLFQIIAAAAAVYEIFTWSCPKLTTIKLVVNRDGAVHCRQNQMTICATTVDETWLSKIEKLSNSSVIFRGEMWLLQQLLLLDKDDEVF